MGFDAHMGAGASETEGFRLGVILRLTADISNPRCSGTESFRTALLEGPARESRCETSSPTCRETVSLPSSRRMKTEATRRLRRYRSC